MKFEDINLVPREISTIQSRSDCDTSIIFCENRISIPIFPSPMVDVVGTENYQSFIDNNIFPFVHRFCPIEEQVTIYRQYDPNKIGASIGLGATGFERFMNLYRYGCLSYILDTANGASDQVIHFVNNMHKVDDKINVIIGNIVSAETLKHICDRCRPYAIRLFIGSGNACATKYNTGVHHDEVDCLIECVRESKNFNVKLIADGGISSTANFVKSLALGADIVCCGSLFAASDESPGTKMSGGYVRYRGSSYSDFKKDKKYVEGYEQTIRRNYKSIGDIVNSFKEGLQSALSYFNCSNMKGFHEKFQNSESYFSCGSNVIHKYSLLL